MNSYSKFPNTTLLDLQRQRFEVLLNQPTNSAYRPSRIGTLLKHLGRSLLCWLTAGDMPRISKQSDQGVETWRVYDPLTTHVRHFEHEDALRTWLEQRYSQ